MSISTNQITALFRSAFPEISMDRLSEKLCSHEGRLMAEKFAELYPLGPLHVSLRSRFFLDECLKNLKTTHDAFISIGSGLSLLSYQLAERTEHTIKFIDTDLEEIVEDRKHSLNKIKEELYEKTQKKVLLKAFDLEKASELGDYFGEYFETKCPLVVMEGVSYYVPLSTLLWLTSELKKMNGSVLILDYFPRYARDGALFKKVIEAVNEESAERVHTYFDQEEIAKLVAPMKVSQDIEIRDVEKELCNTSRLKNLNEMIAARFLTVSS